LLCVLSLDGVALGLFISAAAKTQEAAVSAVPIVLVPQIILAGFITPLDGAADWVARLFVTTFWGYRAIGASLPQDLAELAQTANWSLPAAACVLGIHLAAMAGATSVLLYMDGLRSRPIAGLVRQMRVASQPAVAEESEALCGTIR
jgi:hypothetical protein